MPSIEIFRKTFQGSLIRLSYAIGVLVLFQLLPSCKKDRGISSPFPQPKDSIENINRWILDSMYYYYLYNDHIDASVNLAGSPDAFFNRLVNPNDPFSWISNGAAYPQPKTSFDHYGFHYVIIQLPEYSASQLLGIVTAVAPESPASRAGLERGTYFTKVNKATINAADIEQVVSVLNKGDKITLTLTSNENGEWKDNGVAAFSASYFEERPVYEAKLLQHNGIKAGYVFYNGFEEFFDKDILDVLARFKKENVSELILDLRYNPGGSVATAAKIATAVLKNIQRTETFTIFKGNANMQTLTQQFGDAINSSGNSYKRSFETLAGETLGLNRVFILSTVATASAAEMMINNLRPYIQVVHIGEKTLGKNKAGWVIRDLRQPKKVEWFIQPMIFSIFNASGNGDYENGLQPDYEVKEYDYLPLYPMGNVNDPLVGKAVSLIFSGNTVDEQVLRKHLYRLPEEAVRFSSAVQPNNKMVELHKQ